MCPDFEKIACRLLDCESVTEQEQIRLRAHLHECSVCRREYDEWQNTTRHVRRVLAVRGHEHLETEALLHYADHQIVGAKRLQIQSHLSQCAECRADLALLQRLDMLQASFHLSANRHGVPAKRIRHWLDRVFSGLATAFLRPTGYATALLGIALIGGLYYFMHHSEPIGPALTPETKSVQIRPEIAVVPPAPVKVQTNPPAANHFKALPHLEEMIGMSLRSESLRVLAPAMDTLRTREIVFQWQTDENNLSLKIIDNQEKTVFQSGPVHGVYRYHSTLTPGLYYWKLENREETLWVGKFYISPSMTD